MALDDAKKAKIRRYLGYPDASAYQINDLAGAFERLSAAGEVEVEAILADIATIDTRSTAVAGTAGLARVEDVWFAAGDGFRDLDARRSRLIQELANLLGVSIMTGRGSGFCPRG